MPNLSIKIIFTVIAILGLGGCPWFDSDNDNDPEPTPISTAPTAAFTTAVDGTKAPVIATFSNTSAPGSAAVTQWAWDFGDGNTSSEENPQHSFSQAGTYVVSLQATSSVGTHEATATVEVIPADALLNLSFLNARGFAIDAASASLTIASDDMQIESQAANNTGGLQVAMRPNEAPAMLRIEKAGYVTGLVYLTSQTGIQSKVVTLLAQEPALRVDGFFGGKVSGKDGTTVEFEPESLLRPDGSTETGPVSVFITPVNTNDIDQRNAFPGSFLGRPDSLDEDIPIYSYGATKISLLNEAGETLQLRTGATARLELPIYINQHLGDSVIAPGDSIPMWILNESSGIWEQEGLGSVVANPLAPSGFSLAASTSHFSWFNTDAWGTPSSGAGGQGNLQWCSLNLFLLGVEIDQLYYLTISRGTPGFPSSRVSDLLVFDGEPITSRVPQGGGFIASARLSQSTKTGRTGFLCRDGSAVERTIDLDPDQPPEFVNWEPKLEPVFEFNDDTELYEIVENKVRLGGNFTRAETVSVEAPFLLTPLQLPPDAYLNQRYTPLDLSPQTVTATLENDFGTTITTNNIEYIAEQSPIVDSIVVSRQSELITTFNWRVQGADSVTLAAVPDTLPTSVGVPIIDTDPNNFPTVELGFSTDVLNEYEGVIRVTFTNQYGDTDVYVQLFPGSCDPNSDLPCGAI